MDDLFYEELSNTINGAFDKAFGNTPKPKKKPMNSEQPLPELDAYFIIEEAPLTLENYKAQTGKRYRMTKEQKSRLVSGTVATQEERQAAFNEFNQTNGAN